VRSALAAVTGVHAVSVSVDDEAAYVAYDATVAPDEKAAVAAMVSAIEQAGYKAWKKTDGWPDGVTATPVAE
jgi:copper chaperone CopZ